jgi:hypothetical protein
MTTTIRKSRADLSQKNLNKRYEERRRLSDSTIEKRKIRPCSRRTQSSFEPSIKIHEKFIAIVI